MNFKELIENNQRNVRGIIRLITKENNEDLEQEVYVKVWKNAHKYNEQGSFKSWINTVARNISKDYLKSAYRKNQDSLTSDEIA
ncbi:MAG: sigma-70 family RNA polymerase sigma factor, partial [Heliobacteriaceae bacterium]|nr:sigma-70 family RNA polymerase sigma factor [Heliobacteriaceae bacterium]